MHALAAVIAFVTFASPLWAAPYRYALDTAASTVGFEVDFGQDAIRGTMPVSGADILLDLDRPGQSRVAVTLDARQARAGFIFATEALKGESVLDAGHFPTISFESTDLSVSGARAEVEGRVTIRGVTRPVRLSAQFFRQAGTAEGDLSALSVHLNATVQRSDFGATGYSDLVGDTVRVSIVARIDRQD